jgi:hypothetical protein
MMSKIIKILEWLIIDFESLILSTPTGRLSLQMQPIPALQEAAVSPKRVECSLFF